MYNTINFIFYLKWSTIFRYSPDAQSDYETTKEQTMTDSSTNMLSKLVRPKISVPTKQTCNIVYNCTIIISKLKKTELFKNTVR